MLRLSAPTAAAIPSASATECSGSTSITRHMAESLRAVIRRRQSSDGHGGVPGQPLVPEHQVDQGPAGAAVPVGERVDRLELGVGDRRLSQDGQVVACGESHEIVDGAWDPAVVGRDEVGADGGAATAADPDRFLAPTGQFRAAVQDRPLHELDLLRGDRPGSRRACDMACTFAAMTAAFPEPSPVISASAIARADAVICSICDDEADSDRSRTPSSGPDSRLPSVSNAAILAVASSRSARIAPGIAGCCSAMGAGMALW